MLDYMVLSNSNGGWAFFFLGCGVPLGLVLVRASGSGLHFAGVVDGM